MNPLSQTRSARQPTHLLQTPDTFVRTPMPGITGGVAIVHASPDLGAKFLQYTLELDPGGTLAPSPHQRFLYVLSGDAQILDPGGTEHLTADFYAYRPTGDSALVTSTNGARIEIIEKVYESLPNQTAPGNVISEERLAAATPLNGDPDVIVRTLLPAGVFFDFAVNTMTYAPNAALSQVEIHYMEHGLLMLEGAGPYLLNDTTYATQAGDFIWMAPYCPQWFQASAAGPAKYLIYKNFNRMPAL